VPAGGYYSGSVTLVNGVPHAVFPAYFIDGPCIGVNAWNGLLPQFFQDNLKRSFIKTFKTIILKTIICQDKLGTNTQKTGNAPPTCFCADPWLPGHDKNKCRMVYQYATPTNLSDPYLANWTQPRSFVWPEQGVQVRKRLFVAILRLKTIILPRQAQDKHRENLTSKEKAFCAGERGSSTCFLSNSSFLVKGLVMLYQDRLGTKTPATFNKRELLHAATRCDI